VAVSMRCELIARITELARGADRSRNHVFTVALSEYLARHEPAGGPRRWTVSAPIRAITSMPSLRPRGVVYWNGLSGDLATVAGAVSIDTVPSGRSISGRSLVDELRIRSIEAPKRSEFCKAEFPVIRSAP
jgi:hypothetical protein